MKKKHILEMFEAMGIKDVSSSRQKKNGTTVFEIPYVNHLCPDYKFRFAEYETGYVRSLNGYCCYQINKKIAHKKTYTSSYDGKTREYDVYERVLIPKRKDRLKYLLKFLIKNYFGKVRTHVKYETYEPYLTKQQSITVLVDGQPHNIQ